MNLEDSTTFSILVTTVSESVMTMQLSVSAGTFTALAVDYNGLCLYQFKCPYNYPDASRAVGTDRLLEVTKHRGAIRFAHDLSSATVESTTIDLPAREPECAATALLPARPVASFHLTVQELRCMTVDLCAGGEFLCVHVDADHAYFTSLFECGAIQYEMSAPVFTGTPTTSLYAVKFLKFIHVTAAADYTLFVDEDGALNFESGRLRSRVLAHPPEDVPYETQWTRRSVRERINTVDRQT
jgi:hypothetical protein